MNSDHHKKKGKPGPKGPSDKQVATFLEHLAWYGNVTRSAQDAGITRIWLYKRRKEDPEFAKAWEEAAQIGDQALEDEARRRAFSGWEEPIGKQETVVDSETGEVIERRQQVVRKYSDTLLIFLMKGNNPDKYRDRQEHRHTGPDGGPVQTVDLSRLTDDELARLKDLASKTRQE